MARRRGNNSGKGQLPANNTNTNIPRTVPGAQPAQATNPNANNGRNFQGPKSTIRPAQATHGKTKNGNIVPGPKSFAQAAASNLEFLSSNAPKNAWLASQGTPATSPPLAPRVPAPFVTPAASPVSSITRPTNQGSPVSQGSPVNKGFQHGHDNLIRRDPITPPKSPSHPQRKTVPWECHTGYAEPAFGENGHGSLRYQWDGPWETYHGKDPEDEWAREVEAYKFLALPIPTADMSKDRLGQIKFEYDHMGRPDVLNARLHNMEAGVRFDPTLIFTSNMPSLSDTSTWSSSNQPVEPTETPMHHALANCTDPSLLQYVANGGMSEYYDNPNLFNLLAMPEIGENIINNLKPSLRDLSALGMACKRTSHLVRQYFEVWDFKTGTFPVDRFETKTEMREVNGKTCEVVTQGGGVRSHILLITGAGNDSRETKHPYSESFDAMIDLLSAVRKAPSSFRDLVLHQIPFLNFQMLRILINSMPNLETLSISGCLLLDASRLSTITHIIRHSPRKHVVGGKVVEKFIKVDFSPYRFFGPQSGDQYGSYLLTHNKPTFDIPKAATALLLRCLPEADKIGMDLISDGSSFWHFFRQLPGPCPLWAVKVRETIARMRINQRQEEHAKEGEKPVPKYDPDLLLDNLCAAVSGDFRAPCQIPSAVAQDRYGMYVRRRMKDLYWREYWSCPACGGTELPASLFIHCMPKEGPVCWACEYQGFAREIEHSHFRYRKLIIIEQLLDGFRTTATVNDILMKDEELKAVRKKREPTPKDENSKGNGKPKEDEKKSESESKEDSHVEDASASTSNDDAAKEVDGLSGASASTEANREEPTEANQEELTEEELQRRKEEEEEAKWERLEDLAAMVYRNPRLNYYEAYALAILTDDAWTYYKNLPTQVKADRKSELSHFVELDVGSSEGHIGGMYRFLRCLNPPTGPVDYRQGGPQLRHPAAVPLDTTRAKPNKYKVSEKEFSKAWRPRRQHFFQLKHYQAEEIRREVTTETDFPTWLTKKTKSRKRLMALHAGEMQRKPATETDFYQWLAGRSREYKRLVAEHAAAMEKQAAAMEQKSKEADAAGEIEQESAEEVAAEEVEPDFFTWVTKKSNLHKRLLAQHTYEISREVTAKTDYCKWLLEKSKELWTNLQCHWERVMDEDQSAQNNNDWRCFSTQLSRIEDSIFSLSTQGFVIHNLDQEQFEKDTVNSEWNLGGFRRK